MASSGRLHGFDGNLTVSGNGGYHIAHIKSFTIQVEADLEQDNEFGDTLGGAKRFIRGIHRANGSFEAWFDTGDSGPALTNLKLPGTVTDGTFTFEIDDGWSTTASSIAFAALIDVQTFQVNRTGFTVVRGTFRSSGAITVTQGANA